MTRPRAQACRRARTVKYELSNVCGLEVQGLWLWEIVVGGGCGAGDSGCSTGGGYLVNIGMECTVLCVLERGRWCCVDGSVGNNDALNTVYLHAQTNELLISRGLPYPSNPLRLMLQRPSVWPPDKATD